ncbi:MAG TPA: VIT1/CCC1 transporter family protein [Candidatus Obscuribacterales bacterium]
MRPRHVEHHFTASDTLRDIIIGVSDGLTVPFALAAGLSGALSNNAVVTTAGLAEIAAGSISMGLGGWLAARSDAEHYFSERKREVKEVKEIPEEERKEVRDVFRSYGLNDDEIKPILNSLEKRPHDWVDFMMRFELGLEKPHRSREWKSALTIGGSYFLGGLLPLLPYMLIHESQTALLSSVAITSAALLIFGFVKGRFTGTHPFITALQTLVVGGIAAGVAFALAKAISH